MTGPEATLFVVVLTDDHLMSSPRAIGPFTDYDIAQTFSQTLIERWLTEERTPPTATVVRVEADLPGVLVGDSDPR
jgi:hypothetical protein